MDPIREDAINKLNQKKAALGNESVVETRERIKNAVKPRDEAMKTIAKYQDEVGAPSDDEVAEDFLKETGIVLDEEFLENDEDDITELNEDEDDGL
jgi:hypothetical protein